MPVIKIRYNPVVGAVFVVLGVLTLALAVVSSSFSIGYFSGPALLLLGLCYCFGTAAEIQPHLVKVKSPIQITVKSAAIHGLGDLIVVKSTLIRRGDGKKLLNMGWGSVRSNDLEVLRRTVGWQR